jgi:hypothetical protein
MTGAEISELVTAGVALLTALSAWLKSHSAQKTARAASAKADKRT